MAKCVNAIREGGSSLHCAVLRREKKGKWDFCIHQFICPKTGRSELSKGAWECAMLKDRGKEGKT